MKFDLKIGLLSLSLSLFFFWQGYSEMKIKALFFRKSLSPRLLIPLVVQPPVTRNDGRQMLWVHGRRKHDNACSRCIKEWEGHSYYWWVLCCSSVTKFQALIAFNKGKPHDFVWINIHSYSRWWWSFSCSVISNFWNPMNCGAPESSLLGVSQARILEWAAISSFIRFIAIAK